VSLIDDYVIPYHGLKEGLHEYDFEAKSGFFEFFDNPDIQAGNLEVKLKLIKTSQFMELKFKISGFLRMFCDRCLEEFDQKVDTEAELIVRFGDEFEEISDKLIVVPREEGRINIAQYIYEYAALSLPVQNIHPDDENGNSTCNKEMLKKLEELSVSGTGQNEDIDNYDNIDPRWELLKKLKDLN
jgi:uncharacterized metal-binding protein YceD (DUF177 family)